MEQTIAWFMYELKDTAYLFWYNGSWLLVMILCALGAATWFSARRS